MKKTYNKKGNKLLHFMRGALLTIVILLVGVIVAGTYNYSPVFAGVGKNLIKAPQKTQEKVLIDAPILSQYPEYPTGCESISAMMLLRYYGFEISADDFIDEFLPLGDLPMGANTVYAEDPNEYFIGNPRDDRSYGCYAPVIQKALNGVFEGSDFSARAVKNTTLESVADKAIKNGKPALVWVSMNMKKTTVGQSWILPDGARFTWMAGEHCMLFVGYSETEYYFNDPMTGKLTAYRKELCEERFSELGGQAVLVDNTQN